MAYGLEVYNAAGQVTLTQTSRIARIVGIYSVSVGPRGTVNTTVPGFTADDIIGYADLNTIDTRWVTLSKTGTGFSVFNTDYFVGATIRIAVWRK